MSRQISRSAALVGGGTVSQLGLCESDSRLRSRDRLGIVMVEGQAFLQDEIINGTYPGSWRFIIS
jgi:hypothetical protein